MHSEVMVQLCLRLIDQGQVPRGFQISLGVIHRRGGPHQQVVESGFRRVTDFVEG